MQMVVADADEMFVPLVDGFLVNIAEAELLIDKCVSIRSYRLKLNRLLKLVVFVSAEHRVSAQLGYLFVHCKIRNFAYFSDRAYLN